MLVLWVDTCAISFSSWKSIRRARSLSRYIDQWTWTRDRHFLELIHSGGAAPAPRLPAWAPDVHAEATYVLSRNDSSWDVR